MTIGVVDGYLGAEGGGDTGQDRCEGCAGIRAEGYAIVMPPRGVGMGRLLVDGAWDAPSEQVPSESHAAQASADDGDGAVGAHGRRLACSLGL